MGQPNTGNTMDSLRGIYFSVLDAMKLINQLLKGIRGSWKKLLAVKRQDLILLIPTEIIYF